MNATFALLTDNQTSNFVRKLAWQIHLEHRTGVDVRRLPPHISLKQPFAIADLAALEVYLSEFANHMEPISVSLSELQLVETTADGVPTGILWLDVNETPLLRQLHTQLNQELAVRFGNTQAAFDGSQYHFHLTVAMGGQSVGVYHKIYEEIRNKPINLWCQSDKLAMFVYEQNKDSSWEYMVYKVVPLGQAATNAGQ